MRLPLKIFATTLNYWRFEVILLLLLLSSFVYVAFFHGRVNVSAAPGCVQPATVIVGAQRNFFDINHIGVALHIGDGEFITAAHILGEQRSPVIRDYEQRFLGGGVVIGIREDLDLALIYAPQLATHAQLKLNTATDIFNSKAFVYNGNWFGEGTIVKNLSNNETETRLIYALRIDDGEIGSGLFGAPVVDCDQSFGIMVESDVDNDGNSIAIFRSSQEILDAMDSMRENITEPWRENYLHWLALKQNHCVSKAKPLSTHWYELMDCEEPGEKRRVTRVRELDTTRPSNFLYIGNKYCPSGWDFLRWPSATLWENDHRRLVCFETIP
jgi:hypothetical protein